MPRFITVNLQCDWTDCSVIAPAESEEVIERTITLDRSKPKVVLVCKQHSQDLDDVLLPLMQKGTPVLGTAKPAPKKAGGGAAASRSSEEPDFTCREADCGRSLKNSTGMAQHVIRTHGYESLAAYHEAHGLTG